MIFNMIVLGAALAAVVVGIRGARAEKEFARRCKKQMLEENEDIVELCREAHPNDPFVDIERSIEHKGFPRSTITVRRRYWRNP